MKKALDQLLKVRDLREQEAARVLAAQRIKVDEATRLRDEAERRVEDWRRHALDEELRIYRELCAHPVRVHLIRRAQDEVDVLRKRLKELEQELQTAQAQLEKAQAQLEVDRAAYTAALRRRDKVSELVAVVREAELGERAAKEEAELQEAAELRPVAGPVEEVEALA